MLAKMLRIPLFALMGFAVLGWSASGDKPDIPCTNNFHLFMQGSWIKVSYQELVQKKILEKIESIDRLVTQYSEKRVQVGVSRVDGFTILHQGILKKDTDGTLFVLDVVSGQRKKIDKLQILSLEGVEEWRSRFGLLKLKSNDPKYLAGKVLRVDDSAGRLEFFNTSTRGIDGISLNDIETFMDLSNYRNMKGPVVTKALFHKKVRYENSIHVAEMDLELVEWERGSLVFSSVDTPDEFFEVRVSDLESFYIKN